MNTPATDAPAPVWNPDAGITVTGVGDEGNAVIIVDDAFANADALRQAGLRQRYQAIGPFYPGVRAPTGPAYTSMVLESLSGALNDHFGDDAKGVAGESFFSLVSTPPEKLLPIQRLPHYDGCGADQFAAIAYLSHDDWGGTSFFRHRATGFETVSMARFEPYKAALERDVKTNGLPPQAYLTDGAPLFDRIATVEARFNRLVFYRGVQLHSGAIVQPERLSPDPAKGRLTITSFFRKP